MCRGQGSSLRVGDFAAGLIRCGNGRIDIVHQAVGPHTGFSVSRMQSPEPITLRWLSVCYRAEGQVRRPLQSIDGLLSCPQEGSRV